MIKIYTVSVNICTFCKVGVCDVDLLLGKDVFTFMFILCLFCIIACDRQLELIMPVIKRL